MNFLNQIFIEYFIDKMKYVISQGGNRVFVFVLCKYIGKAYFILLLNSKKNCFLFLFLCSSHSYKNRE
jgi:hypothetical protein